VAGFNPTGGRRKIEEGIHSIAGSFDQDSAYIPNFPTFNYSSKAIYTYDSTIAYGRGRLASWNSGDFSFASRRQYDALGRIIEESVRVYPLTDVLEYNYDWQGNLLDQSIDNGMKIYYDYDIAGRLVTVGTAAYWPTGQVRQDIFRRNADTVCQRVDYIYNPRDWLLRINHPDSLPFIFPFSTGDDRFGIQLSYLDSYNGNVDTMASKQATEAKLTEILTYDRVGRINRWHDAAHGASTINDYVYKYDRVGNITQRSMGPTNYTYYYAAGNNQIDSITTTSLNPTISYTWDVNGNMTSEPGFPTYQYTHRNKPYYITIPKTNWTNRDGPQILDNRLVDLSDGFCPSHATCFCFDSA